MTWQEFVVRHGRYQPARYLAVIVGQPEQVIERYRQGRPTVPGQRLSYAELFALFRGHEPASDSDYPVPQRAGDSGRRYEWLGNELALLASLVGRLSVPQISQALTTRLRALTGDDAAERNVQAVQIAINRVGLQTIDFVGGVSVRSAVQRTGETLSVVQQAVSSGDIRTRRVGHRHVIPFEELDRWLASRDKPPAGWIRLSTVAKALQIRSDSKLPEYAKAGYVPDTVFVKSRHLWFIKPERADQIIADARAGRPLPWHGKPFLGNLRASWKKWQQRRHRRCAYCIQVWGPAGPPRSFADFARRYPDLDLGVKRHLTVKQQKARTWKPRRPWGSTRAFRGLGVTPKEAARQLEKPLTWVRSHIARGTVRPLRDPHDRGESLRISKSGMAKLEAVRDKELRGRPRGFALRHWLGLHAAAEYAGVSIATVQNWAAAGDVKTKRGPRGFLYSQESIQDRARLSWANGRIRARDAAKPEWLIAEERGTAA